MSKSSLARVALPFILVRVNPNGTERQASKHPDFGSGWSAGQRAVHEDREHAYTLYRGGRRVAKFAHARLQPRRPAGAMEWVAGLPS